MILPKIFAVVLGAVAVAGFSTANATQVDGTVGFTSGSPASANSLSAGAGSASQSGGVTSIHFNNPMFVNFGSQNYTGTESSAVTFSDFSFSGSGTSAALMGGSVASEWTFSSGGKTFSFDLTHLTSGTFTPGVHGGLNAFSLQGEGIAHVTGLQDTMAAFSIQGTGTRFTFTILQASNTAVAAVPENGSALTLLGLGLLAVEVVRRKLVA